MTIHIRSNSNTYKHTSRNWNTCLRLQMNRKSIFISLYYDKRANKIISPYFFLKCYYLLIILKYVRIKCHWKKWSKRKSGNIIPQQRKSDFNSIWKFGRLFESTGQKLNCSWPYCSQRTPRPTAPLLVS